jgi:uncharacterized protein YndB with AHSA1/START domain
MTTTTTSQLEQGLHIERTIDIQAPSRIVWEALLEEIGPGMLGENRKPMQMKLEPWPGGRYYRDLGNDAGHLWGYVQVIKPPALLEITGPLFMSYAAINHVQYRLSEKSPGNSTRLSFIHRAFGDIPADHREGVAEGWAEMLENIRKAAEKH